MSRPVQYNNTVKFQGIPEGYMGEGFMATNFEKWSASREKIQFGPFLLPPVVAVLNSWPPWPVITTWLVSAPKRVGFSPRQCDLLMVMGTIAKKMGPVLKQVYLQMAEPPLGDCGGCMCKQRGIFDTYSVLQGIDQVIPVDVYVPGCPPRPAILDGFMKIQELVNAEGLRRRHSDQYKDLLGSYGIQ